jgi:peroxiredoxin
MRTAVGALVLAVALLVALGTIGRDDAGRTGSTSVALDRATGQLSFELETFAGGTLASQDLSGRPAVLNGYASWCTVCDRELPDFQRVHERVGSRVQVVGFNPQSNDSDAAQQRMITRAGVTYPTVRDVDDRLLRQFNPTGGLPVTVFVDEDGVVRKVHRGLLTEQLLLSELRDLFGIEV